jgi:CRP-like cAMP-binding protein
MGTEQPAADRRGNAILNALPAAIRDRLMAEMTLMPLKIKTVLFDAGEVISHVYFPTSGVISLVTPLEEGSIVEVATIGNEGIVGIPIQPHGSLAVRAISQVAGSVLRMDAETFLAEADASGPLRNAVRNYTLALFGQISQAAACNRLHSSEERLSRWLLMSRDRVGRDDFRITHDFLGQMLGSRRATVSLSAGLLQSAGLIRYSRGRVVIRDRRGLEAASCECYGVIRRLFESPAPVTTPEPIPDSTALRKKPNMSQLRNKSPYGTVPRRPA